ncbi:hypothetical protein HKI87_09g58930 [Chloropicon roscoffensis]|uniref:Uncharacterized protein n=1 Tax=Chloropicon roscoffensis TaxID=1461544 RepID=A0AAX4PEC9_9CHLO
MRASSRVSSSTTSTQTSSSALLISLKSTTIWTRPSRTSRRRASTESRRASSSSESPSPRCLTPSPTAREPWRMWRTSLASSRRGLYAADQVSNLPGCYRRPERGRTGRLPGDDSPAPPRSARAETEDRSNARLADGRWFWVARYEKGEEEAEEERQEEEGEMRDEGLGQHGDHRGGEEGHALKIKVIYI